MRRSTIFTLALASTALHTAAFAQQVSPGSSASPPDATENKGTDEGLDIFDIVVTAQKRSENAQRVGISINAFQSETLRQQNVSNAQDLQKLVPGLRMESPGSPVNTTFTVRGVGQRDIADHNEAAVVVFSDGAYVSWLGAAGVPLYDLERVEVLKGPQGTLFGRNATGGLINIVTAKPTRNFEGYLKAQVGSHGQYGFEGALSGPLSNTLSGRLSFFTNAHDGFFENASGPDKQSQENYNVRGQLRWEPSSDLTMDLLARATWFTPSESGGISSIPLMSDANGISRRPNSQAEFAAYCQATFPAAPLLGYTLAPAGSSLHGNCFTADGANPFRGNWHSSKFSNYFQDYSLTVDYALSDTTSLISITDYQHISKSFDSVPSATPVPELFDYFAELDGEQFSQEVRLNGTGEGYNWIVGGFYFRRDDNVNSYIGTMNNPAILARLGAAYSVRSESIAAFGQGEYEISDHLKAIVGGRFTHDTKDLDNEGYCIPNPAATGAVIPGVDQCTLISFAFPNSLQFNGFNGGFKDDSISFKAQLDYTPTDDLLIYAGVNRGTKAGGFNSGGAAFYDVGSTIYKPEKITSYEAGFKATLFDRTTTINGALFHYDYQNYQSYVSVFGSLQVFNVDAKVNGAELEINTRPVPGLTLRGAVNYLDAKQKDVPFQGGARDFVMPNAPKWTLNGMVRYEHEMAGGTPAVQASVVHVTERTTNAIDFIDLRLPEYTRIDLRAEFTTADGNWTGAVFVDNVTDERILIIRVPIEGLVGGTSDTYDRPRWFGASIVRRF